ncbi:MAG: peptide/nickel transport system permease protein [Caballeronia sp.]|jgi:peptide/nickel transport system permease protein|nr:peptide/nickel transport system permease protein [Caballeronia sp.]
MERKLSAPLIPAVTGASAALRSPGYWSNTLRRVRKSRVALAAGTVVALLLLMAIFAPWIVPHDPFQASMLDRLKPVGTPGHLLGTDELGRDLLSRLIMGGRLSLFMGIAPVVIAFVVGGGIGIFAGYAGGLANTLVMRTVDVFYAFPSVLLAVALSGTIGAGIKNALLSLTIVFIPQVIRVAESVTTQLRNSDFIDAARSSGASPFTIVRVQLLGNVLGPIFVYATSLISVSMILAAGLSFLGLGVTPPSPEWGLMLNALRNAIYTQPVIAALPGAMIFITSISFNLLADAIRQAMEIKG